MKSLKITNREELKAEIGRLDLITSRQQADLKKTISNPVALATATISLIKGSGKNKVPRDQRFHGDYFTLAAKFLIPLTLKKTIFRHSNFLIKSFAGFLSEKAAAFVTTDRLTGLVVATRANYIKFFNSRTSYPSDPH